MFGTLKVDPNREPMSLTENPEGRYGGSEMLPVATNLSREEQRPLILEHLEPLHN